MLRTSIAIGTITLANCSSAAALAVVAICFVNRRCRVAGRVVDAVTVVDVVDVVAVVIAIVVLSVIIVVVVVIVVVIIPIVIAAITRVSIFRG